MELWNDKILKGLTSVKLEGENFDLRNHKDKVIIAIKLVLKDFYSIGAVSISQKQGYKPDHQGNDVIEIKIENSYRFEITLLEQKILLEGFDSDFNLYNPYGFAIYEIENINSCYKRIFHGVGGESNLEIIPNNTIVYADVIDELILRTMNYY